VTDLVCSQCGRPAPADSGELARWEHGPALAAESPTDETAPLLLCPECWSENRDHAFEEGGGD
jgi:hypothetical protein